MNIRRFLRSCSVRCSSISSSEICGTQGRATRKRLSLGAKPLISLILIIGIMFSFSVSSSASSAVTYRLADFEIVADSDVPVEFRNDKLNGEPCTRIVYSATPKVKVSAFRKISDEFKSGNSYTLTFTVRKGTVGDGYISFLLLLSDSPTSIDNAIELVSFHTGDMAQGAVQDFSIQTSYPDDFNGKQCYLVALIVSNGASGTYITDFVFTNNNQTEEKIDGILEWLSATYHGIVGGEDSRGVKHDGLVQGIKNGLNSLGDRIVNTFNNLKVSIENKIDAIQQWFEDLGENIIEGIKGLFIPEDGYFEQKKSELENFFSEHFGIVYTAGSLGVNVIRQFTSLKPPETAVLKVPAWQMTLPLENDKVITLVPAMDVNFKEHITNNGVLHTFYNFYRAFITVVLIFMVVNYARRKYNYVFGKDGEGVE